MQSKHVVPERYLPAGQLLALQLLAPALENCPLGQVMYDEHPAGQKYP